MSRGRGDEAVLIQSCDSGVEACAGHARGAGAGFEVGGHGGSADEDEAMALLGTGARDILDGGIELCRCCTLTINLRGHHEGMRRTALHFAAELKSREQATQ